MIQPPSTKLESNTINRVGSLYTGSRAISIGVLALAHAVNDSYAFVLQALLPAIIPSLGLTLGLAGVLVSLYQVTSSLVQPAIGYISDRQGLRWPAWAGVAASGIAAGLIGIAPHYLALVGLLLLGGIGTAIFHPIGGAMVGGAAPEHARGRWIGMFVTAGNFGNALGPLVLGFMLDRSGLAGTWPIMLPALAMSALVFIFAPRPSPPKKGMPSLTAILRQHRRVLSTLILVITLRAWITSTILTFLPLLGQQRGLGLGEAAQTMSIFLFAAAVGGFLGGVAADRWGRDRVIIGSLLLSVPFGMVMALRPEVDVLFYLTAAIAGFFLNSSFVVLTIRGQESLPASTGMITGITLGLSIGLGGLAVTPMALLAEHIGLPGATAVAAAMGILAALAMLLVPPLPAKQAQAR